MVLTNSRFTILDDESTILTVAGHPLNVTLSRFLIGEGQHEHPPASDLLLHIWLLATHYSLYGARIFANLFYIAGTLLLAQTARRMFGDRAWWLALGLAFLWPFSFQYARITGWYCFCYFAIAWVTMSYLGLIDRPEMRVWLQFGFASFVLLWSNYFGAFVLGLLLLDLLVFHRTVARANLRPLLAIAGVLTLSSAPLLKAFLLSVSPYVERPGGWARTIAALGYTLFSAFGSVAVAPWFLPLSVPVVAGAVAMAISSWSSPGRRWLIYFLLALIALACTGEAGVKRIVFLLPWLFLALTGAIFGNQKRLACAGMCVLIAAGWIGIISGRHYSTSNLYEPWQNVAEQVANNARAGTPVISANLPFFLYLDYDLNLEPATDAEESYLGEALYRAHGYTMLKPSQATATATQFHGPIVLVLGSGDLSEVAAQNDLHIQFDQRCRVTKEFRAAPDPAADWKQRFVHGVPVLEYRTHVIWYDCPH